MPLPGRFAMPRRFGLDADRHAAHECQPARRQFARHGHVDVFTARRCAGDKQRGRTDADNWPQDFARSLLKASVRRREVRGAA